MRIAYVLLMGTVILFLILTQKELRRVNQLLEQKQKRLEAAQSRRAVSGGG